MRLPLRPAVIALAAISLTLAARSEPPYRFETTPGKLPKNVVPHHYAVRIQPDIESLSFTGSETVEIEVVAETTRIVLSASELEIQEATFDGAAVPFSIDSGLQQLTLTFPAAAGAGKHTVSFRFTGRIFPEAAGLFFDRYHTETGDKVMLGTQFEVPFARRVFPCWDEPVFRATFDITAIVPERMLAVSNMPVSSERLLDNGLREVAFGRSPSMPTYLVGLFIGEFETLEGEVDGIKVRVVTTEGKRDSGAYALESAKKVLAYYHDYFGAPYPLPKLDLIGVPNAFATFGAMENWGCISFLDSILLYDPATGSENTRESIFSVTAHEIAHQWFGNIVTMAWWDNLWLNEGFATWLGDKATNVLNPEWQILNRGSYGRENAMTFDSGPSTHAVQTLIPDDTQAMYSFDSISYDKGRAVLDMLESYVGEDAFRAGIRNYIEEHKYSNTTTADLWSSIERGSGKSVSDMATGWIEQPGLPVVHVSLAAHGDHIVLSQEKFQIGGEGPAPTRWRIPVSVANSESLADTKVVLLDDESLSMPVPPGAGATIANVGNIGFFRTHYEGALAGKVAAEALDLPVPNQVGLISDSWALVEAGTAPATDLLALIEGMREAQAPVVISRIADRLVAIDLLYFGQPGRSAFRAWASSVLAPRLEVMGWVPKDGETLMESELRYALIDTLGRFGHVPTVEKCRALFADHVSGRAAIPSSIRGAVFNVAGRFADRRTWDQLREIARTTTSTIEANRAYAALRRAEDPELVQAALLLALDKSVPPTTRTYYVAWVAANDNAAAAWEFTKENLDGLLEIIPEDTKYGLVPYVMRPFNDRERADELLEYVGSHFPPEALTEAEKAADSIRRRAATRDRELPRIDSWIAAHPATRG